MDHYNENTTPRKYKTLLGQEVEPDDGLEWRVKWGQRGAGVSGLSGLICWLRIKKLLLLYLLLLCLCLLVCLQKRLVRDCETAAREMNVVIISYSVCSHGALILRDPVIHSVINGLMYLLLVFLLYFWTP